MSTEEFTIDLSLRPTMILDREDIEAPIREALAPIPQHATVDLPGVTLTLDHCVYPDGTPIWDHPLTGHSGKVTAVRTDGEQLIIPTEDGHDWDSLADRLVDFMGDWDIQAAALLSEVQARGRRIKALEKQLANEISDLTPLVQQAQKVVTVYRISQLTGLLQPRIARMIKN